MNELKELVDKLIEIEKENTKKGYKNKDLFCLCYVSALIRAFEHGGVGIFGMSPHYIRLAGEVIYDKLLEEEEEDE